MESENFESRQELKNNYSGRLQIDKRGGDL
jgi:hypothetical protein